MNRALAFRMCAAKVVAENTVQSLKTWNETIYLPFKGMHEIWQSSEVCHHHNLYLLAITFMFINCIFDGVSLALICYEHKICVVKFE